MLPVNVRRPRIRPIPITPPRYADDEPVSGIIQRIAPRDEDEYEDVDESDLVLIAAEE
jgi:hypothetical protein